MNKQNKPEPTLRGVPKIRAMMDEKGFDPKYTDHVVSHVRSYDVDPEAAFNAMVDLDLAGKLKLPPDPEGPNVLRHADGSIDRRATALLRTVFPGLNDPPPSAA